MTVILDGKALAKSIRKDLKDKISTLKMKHNKVPGLAVIIVGDNPASQAYVNRKEKVSANLGMNSRQIQLPKDIPENELLNTIYDLNNDNDIHAILLQLPLPDHIDESKIIMAIRPEKDVDGFHPENMGRLLTGLEPYAIPCTPFGIIKLLDAYNIDYKGKNAVVIGRSNIVGKPISILLMARHATVTICHSRTKNIDEVCRQADIIIVAIGKESFLKKEWVKEGAIIVDVGINRNDATGKIVGDVDYDNISPITSYITPVPGGVGPMTIATLMANTVSLFEKTLI